MGHKFSKTLSICFLALCIICTLSSCSKIPFLSSFFSDSGSASTSTSASEPFVIEYQQVTVKDLYEELENNILRAERKYQDEYVELTGELESINSSGKYFLMIASDNGISLPWAKDTVHCAITDESQVNSLLEKNVGDLITVHGQITKVKESSGYSLKLIEIVETDIDESLEG